MKMPLMEPMASSLRAVGRFGWSLSLFGAESSVSVLGALAGIRGGDEAAATLDSVGRAARTQLGRSLTEAYEAGERFQTGAVDAVYDAAAPFVEMSRRAAAATLLVPSLETMRSAAGLIAATPAGGPAWRELANKLEAFGHFRRAPEALGYRRPADLAAAACRAPRASRYRGLWLIEGLGHAHGEAVLRRDDRPRAGLLRAASLDGVPAGRRLALHTGLGLALARSALPALTGGRGEEASEGFLAACDAHAAPGFELAVVEALGLMTRQLAPHRLIEVGGLISRRSVERGLAYWHGVGRGLYFVASQALPGSASRAVAKARDEAAGDPARLNVLAGLAWAVTLVNFRHPEVLHAFLESTAWRDEEEDAVAHGIAGAATLWRDACGREGRLDALIGHREDARWRQRVGTPVEEAMAGYPALRDGPGLGRLFVYLPEEKR